MTYLDAKLAMIELDKVKSYQLVGTRFTTLIQSK